MDTIIEKLANAIEASVHRTKNRGNWEDVARDAVEALIKHGPTQSMLDAGSRNLHILGYDDLPTNGDIDLMFRAMLRAAIKKE